MNALITIMIFRHMLRKRAYTQQQFEELIKTSHFTKYAIEEAHLGFDIWLEK
ncbi:hypothetical protein HUR95_05340 [Caldalkalibacillus thermarum TA2.A1]|uniref:Uncharacterized protein n=1 Tax=Caldalkalibacillus thermarum (strain TA2.A1) TaxID=986075 RepID=A0A8X8IAI5_CALTT|nr:hypothetical protein [Caldalkalibacillus thermarum]QZT34729.1 hypothetical protein HUR95_05340 [Caldalkalibacillus thermarum TA2.A1]